MRYVLFLVLLVVAGCVSRPATTAVVFTSGFPDLHIITSEEAGRGPWAGTARCFRSAGGKIFYFTILFDDSYDKYCTAQLAAIGITNCTIQLGRMSYEQTELRTGFQARPDRVDLSFIVKDKSSGAIRPFHMVYMLPPSSEALGQTAGFTRLGREEQAALCVKSVSSDMEGIAQELVQNFRMSDISLKPAAK